MRTSQFLLSTLRETPSDAEVASHQLMLRAGMIRKLASGLYTWLPLGLRVLRKVEAVVREEMNRAGAQELLMPAVQPAELWQESGRWDEMGEEMLRLQDRHGRDFCFGPTHEEVITDLIRNEMRSYKQLPVTFYQVQTKFRDERRPRFGVMRAREFLMKDAYSFHVDDASLQETYDKMYATYSRIFSRLGLEFRAVLADTGAIGGSASHEFHVLADSGEDAIAFSTESDYAANVELAEAIAPAGERAAPTAEMTTVDTPNVHTIDEVCEFFGVTPDKVVKTIVVEGKKGMVALLLRGDHFLNEIKAEKLSEVEVPLRFAPPSWLKEIYSDPAVLGKMQLSTKEAHVTLDEMSSIAGSLGPVGLNIPVIVDRSVAHMSDFICGANQDGKHLSGVNWGRDLPEGVVVDIRNVVEGDASPDGKGKLQIKRGIEVGHIFQLGRKYSEAMKAIVQAESGKSVVMTMGCYGIGVSRVVASAIEQNNDERGIIWPEAIAPFQIALLPLNMHKSQRLREAVEKLYDELLVAGFDVLLDDRKERPGVMFADMELVGIPHRVVFSEKGLDKAEVEYKGRRDSENQYIPLEQIVDFLKGQFN